MIGRSCRWTMLAVASSVLLASVAAAQGTDEPVLISNEERLDELMADFHGPDEPGAVVAVIRGGEVVFARGYGMADLTHDVPFTPDIASMIASTSKQFTAFAVALLDARGELSLDDDVREYIPELPDFGEAVTLRHLLTHTSGYRDAGTTLPLTGRRAEEARHHIEVVQRQPRLQNSPGTEFNYNNTGYVLAAEVVARVSGRSFPKWMEDELFGPLGMKRTVVPAGVGAIMPRSATGYRPDGSGGFLAAHNAWWNMGAGGIYTTAADLARWMRNLATGELGGRAVVEALVTPNVPDGETMYYGLGLSIDEERGLRRWHHGGSGTHRSVFVYYPDLDAGYIIHGNRIDFPNRVGESGTLPTRVADLFFGEHMEEADLKGTHAELVERKPVGIDGAVLGEYAGRYDLGGEMVVTISFDQDRMFAHVHGLPTFELIATSDSTFTVPAIDAVLTFHRTEHGATEGFTLHDAVRNTTAQRLTVGHVDLAPYAGRYFSQELESYFTIQLEENDLVLDLPWYPSRVIAPVDVDTFVGALVRTLSFERDENASITGFRIDAGRSRDILFERVD
jgi:CubicO group peptidase (beta-lactamase class C family)